MESLFALRGPLSGKQRLVLEACGILFLFIVWVLLAEVSAEKRIIKMDNTIGVADRRYVNNDSLITNDMDKLLVMSNEELKNLGLTTSKAYALLPSPVQVFSSFGELWNKHELAANAGKSIWLNLLGYLVAILISVPLGFLLGLVPLFRGMFRRVFDAMRFIPLTAVTGIFVMWLGLGSEMKVMFLAFGILVYLVPVVIQRIDEVEDVYLKTVFTLGANRWQTIRTVYLPAVISRLSDDVRVLVAISWTYITIAEMLNKSGGLGELMFTTRRQSRIDMAFALLIVIILIGVIQDKLFSLLDRVLFPHKHLNKK